MLPTWLRINATRWQINENQNTTKPAELQLQSVSPPGSWQPDALRQIALEAIEPFFDKTLDARVEAAERQWFKKRTPPARQTPELAIVGRAHRESSHSARRSDGGLSGAPKQDTDQLLYGQASGPIQVPDAKLDNVDDLPNRSSPPTTTSSMPRSNSERRKRLKISHDDGPRKQNSITTKKVGDRTSLP
jgi:hypothetical protein